MNEEPSKLEQLKELAEFDPDDPVVYYGLGTEYLRLGSPVEAEAALRRTIELKPDYSAAYRELGKALEKQNRRGEAIQTYRQGKEVATIKGDLQTGREIDVFLRRLGVS